MRLRLVTLNTWKCDGAYRERLPRMAAGLAALQPHIVLLQECFASADGSAHTARALADTLGLPLWETPARTKPRRWEGRWVHSHAGLALLGDCEPVQALALPPHPADGERVAQMARWRGPGPALWIGHVHLAAGADASAARLQQCQHLTDRLQALAQADSAVLGGDFNAEPQDPALAPLRAGWQLAGEGPAPATWWNAQGQGLALDHWWLRPGATGWQARMVQPVLQGLLGDPAGLASDHSALLVELLPPNA